jgi:hypothetical protein
MDELNAIAIVLDLAISNGIDEQMAESEGLRHYYEQQQEAFEVVAAMLDRMRSEER